MFLNLEVNDTVKSAAINCTVMVSLSNQVLFYPTFDKLRLTKISIVSLYSHQININPKRNFVNLNTISGIKNCLLNRLFKNQYFIK